MPSRPSLLLLALHLGSSWALRRFPDEQDLPPRPLDVSFSTEEDLEDLPDLGDGPDEPPESKTGKKLAASLRDTPFKNVLLVVHCRLTDIAVSRWPGNATNSTFVCEKRRPLLENLQRFFPEMVFWNGEVDCEPKGTSPHHCIAEQLLDRAQNRDGIFYMHFDALVRPEVLKHTFDPLAIGVFNEQNQCDMEDGCNWGPWWKWRKPVMKALKRSAEDGFPVENGTFWLGVDDLFYVPKRVFAAYAKLHKDWPFVHHEVAGPTMWRILGRHASVSVASLGCTGSCCKEVPGSRALAPDFRCGHPFRLNNADVREAFTKAQLMG